MRARDGKCQHFSLYPPPPVRPAGCLPVPSFTDIDVTILFAQQKCTIAKEDEVEQCRVANSRERPAKFPLLFVTLKELITVAVASFRAFPIYSSPLLLLLLLLPPLQFSWEPWDPFVNSQGRPSEAEAVSPQPPSSLLNL